MVAALVAVVLVALLLPVPWLHVVSDDPLGTAWRLDGRLRLDGAVVDPPGEWTWLAVGRPPLVGEWLYGALFGSAHPPTDLRSGSLTGRPGFSEPAAAAVGLHHAGRDVEFGFLVEVRDPLLEGYPATGEVTSVNGIPLTSRQAWKQASSAWEAAAGVPTASASSPPPRRSVVEEITFRLRDGRTLTAPGPGLPYATVNTLDLAPSHVQAVITFQIAQLLPVDWFRELSLGRSHGMMVALTTYAHATEQDLAQGRHIAGTGGIRGDGTVTRVGGVPAKAEAANRAGAEVLFVPTSQVHELQDVALPGTTVVPVETLGEAIDWLRAPRA